MSRSAPETRSVESGAGREPTVREPTLEDAPAMWELVKALDGLEANTLYAYLLFARDFAGTCRVAETEDGVLGLVLGYRPPARPDTLFVWQVGVHPRLQGRGMATRLIQDILSNGKDLHHVEATVAEGNRASETLFKNLARRLGAPSAVSEGFTSDHFHPHDHPPERSFRIGPFRSRS